MPATGTGIVSRETPSAPSLPSPSPSPVNTPSPSATPIPLVEVAAQADVTLADLRAIENDVSVDPLVAAVHTELPVLAREVQARTTETTKVQTVSPSLETLRTLRFGWQHIRETLSTWERDLTRRAVHVEEDLARVRQRAVLWQQTRAQASQSVAPVEVRQRIDTVLAAIGTTQTRAEAHRAEILTLQNRVIEQNVRVSEVLSSLRQAQEAAIDQLFLRSSPPLWSLIGRADAGQTLAHDSQESFAVQATALGSYATRRSTAMLVHLCIGLVLAALLYQARQRIRAWAVEEPDLKRTARVFETPFAVALLLTLLLSGRMYPQAPRLWWTIIGATALIPAIFVLRRLVEARLAPILYALVGFYLMDQLRAVTATLPLVSRLLFVVEMVAGIGCLLWLLLRSRRLQEGQEGEPQEKNRRWRLVPLAAQGAALVFATALIANVLGYTSFAILLGDGVLGSAYFALILYALFRILDDLVFSGLRLLMRVHFIQRHGTRIQHSVRRAFTILGILFWTVHTLELFALRGPLFHGIRAALAVHVTVGSFTVSPENILAFALTVWAAFFVSRLMRFLLEEDVYPRFHLARGLPYAISKMLHYVILLLGFLLSMAALGVDMTKFTILASAFGVGLGFGMQNIVNNFVSGLILLFERPIKIGDVIETADASGVVERIGIRASVVRTSNGSEVIVPNGNFISGRVTNWTYSNNLREITVAVRVAVDTDPERVFALLTETAVGHPSIMDTPPPQVLLVSFDAQGLKIELHAWTEDVEEWEQVRSGLTLAIRAMLARENIRLAPENLLLVRENNTTA